MKPKSEYPKSYFYDREDSSKRAEAHKKRRLRGERLSGNVMAHYTVITEYMRRHSKLSLDNLHLLCFLAGLYGSFNWKNICDYPNGMGIVRSKKKLKELFEHELIEKFDPELRERDIEEPYILTPRAKGYIKLYNDLLLMVKKIPFTPSSSDVEFVNPIRKKENGKTYKNWYYAIKNFNREVENNLE